MATPRTIGRRRSQREWPALVSFTLLKRVDDKILPRDAEDVA